MGSVIRRIRRNIQARSLATRVGICEPIVRYKLPGGKIKIFQPPNPNVITYRTVMLRTLRAIRERHKRSHVVYQRKQADLARIAKLPFFRRWATRFRILLARIWQRISR